MIRFALAVALEELRVRLHRRFGIGECEYAPDILGLGGPRVCDMCGKVEESRDDG